MAILNMVPNLWHAAFLKSFLKEAVYSNVVNRDYEGEIKDFGDTVTIMQCAIPTVAAYTGAALVPESLVGSTQTLVINKKYFANFKVTDIEKAQAKANPMQEYMRTAAVGLRDVIDQEIAGLYAQAGSSVDSATTPCTLKSTNLVEKFGDVAEALNVKNISQNRFMVVSPWVYAKMQITKINTDTSNSTILSNGYVGKFMGFDIYVSNNVSEASAKTGTRIMAGTKDAISLALQVSILESYREEAGFSDCCKILWLWGTKVINPNALCTFYATEAAE